MKRKNSVCFLFCLVRDVLEYFYLILSIIRYKNKIQKLTSSSAWFKNLFKSTMLPQIINSSGALFRKRHFCIFLVFLLDLSLRGNSNRVSPIMFVGVRQFLGTLTFVLSASKYLTSKVVYVIPESDLRRDAYVSFLIIGRQPHYISCKFH